MINLINGKYKGFKNTVMFNVNIEPKVNDEICKNFNCRSSKLEKIGSMVEASFRLPPTRFNSSIISNSKITDYIKDNVTNKIYAIK